jgi:hypothetical protein
MKMKLPLPPGVQRFKSLNYHDSAKKPGVSVETKVVKQVNASVLVRTAKKRLPPSNT